MGRVQGTSPLGDSSRDKSSSREDRVSFIRCALAMLAAGEPSASLHLASISMGDNLPCLAGLGDGLLITSTELTVCVALSAAVYSSLMACMSSLLRALKRLPKATIKASTSSADMPQAIAVAISSEAENPPPLNASLWTVETVSILMVGLINRFVLVAAEQQRS
jgi:hypothetical protein